MQTVSPSLVTFQLMDTHVCYQLVMANELELSSVKEKHKKAEEVGTPQLHHRHKEV